MADAGATQYTFHLEATSDAAALARQIKEAGMKVSKLILLIIMNLKHKLKSFFHYIVLYTNIVLDENRILSYQEKY